MKAEVRKIVAATDFSAPSEVALKVAQQYAERFGATLVVVHALHLTSFIFGEGTFAFAADAEQLVEAARQQLLKLVARCMEDGLACEGVVLQGAPHEEINRYALEQKADLIVIGTQGRTGLASVAFGSVAQRVAQSAPCPVLVVPAPRA